MGIFSGLFGKKTPIDLFKGYTDYHSHLLPGVDDGFGSLDDSLKCLEIYEARGFSDVWLTPHIMEDFPNTTAKLRERFDELKKAYQGSITLHLASENMIDELFMERLEANDFLPIDDRLLVETSYFTPPSNLYEALKEVQHKGYFPLLAHPERYRYMSKDDYNRLIGMGVEFQLNIFSVTGAYGKSAMEKAKMLLRMGAYKCSGTDIHRTNQSDAIDRIIKDRNLNQELLTAGILTPSTPIV